jgi:hypothetical protein
MPTPEKSAFDHLLPAGQESFTCKELAGITGFTRDFFTRAFDEGRIMGISAFGRGNGKRQSIRIPRGNALIWLLQRSNYSPSHRLAVLTEILDCLSPGELDHVILYATKRRKSAAAR